MKHKCYVILPLALFVFLGIMPSLGANEPAAPKKPRAPRSCKTLKAKTAPRKLVEIDPQTFAYKGLTDEGVEAIRQARDTLAQRTQLFDSQLRNLDTLHHAGIVARIVKYHMFLYGPPGGAKSGFVDFMFKGERDKAFRLQMHQMLTESSLTGGQIFEAAKKGKFELNPEGSLADHKVALLDEIEKGNPAALSVLLSLLNERTVQAGGTVIPAKLESLFATSNANLAELFQMFMENGMSSTAPALLNRFHFKSFVYNWLKVEDQAILDMRKADKRFLDALAETHPEVLKHEVYQTPEIFEWHELRQLAYTIFELSPQFKANYLELVNEFRTQTNRAIRESEERHKNNPQEEPFVYFPSADLTERLRQQVPEVVMVSAMVDFLKSDLSAPENIRAATAERIQLDPLSLWRAYLMLTTIGPGKTRLKILEDAASKGVETAEGKIELDFGWSIDPSSARDVREKRLIENLIAEQERFKSIFQSHMSKLNENLELRNRHTNEAVGGESFELLLLGSTPR